MAERTIPIQELVRRARAIDQAALQQLREGGYFAQKERRARASRSLRRSAGSGSSTRCSKTARDVS